MYSVHVAAGPFESSVLLGSPRRTGRRTCKRVGMGELFAVSGKRLLLKRGRQPNYGIAKLAPDADIGCYSNMFEKLEVKESRAERWNSGEVRFATRFSSKSYADQFRWRFAFSRDRSTGLGRVPGPSGPYLLSSLNLLSKCAIQGTYIKIDS
jgi:hypothetical protein